MDRQATPSTAKLYRMVMPGHLCPYGLKSKDLLEREGYEVEDHHLNTREETDAFMEKPRECSCVMEHRLENCSAATPAKYPPL